MCNAPAIEPTSWKRFAGNPETSLPGRKNLHYTPDPLVMDQPLNWRHIPKVIIG